VVFSHFLRAFILKHAISVANCVVKEHAIFTVFKFMLDELKDALLKRINERQTVYSEVLHYLSNPSKPNDVNDYGIFNKSTKLTITKTLVELLRLNLNKDLEETTELSERREKELNF
jgi:hypothetical protein